jgi:hypothetical protein
VAGRELVFSNPEVIRLASEHFIPVAADDWYQRRRQDEEGKFFTSVADQGPRKGAGGSTRQGIYCFTASGKLLAYRNHRDVDVMLGEFRKALSAFKKLPESERAPGAVVVPEAGADKLDRHYTRRPPKDGAIVTIYARVLERDENGKCQTCEPSAGLPRYNLLSAQDHLWLTKEEVASLAPAAPKVGASYPVPTKIAERIARFHLIDNTRGEPPFWSREEIQSQKMTLTVVGATAKAVKLRLNGTALLATDRDTETANRGYDAVLLGHIELARDAKSPKLTRFDLVALGDHWGQGRFTGGARPGRQPLGISFELAPGDKPADQVPPQAARNIGEYLNGS